MLIVSIAMAMAQRGSMKHKVVRNTDFVVSSLYLEGNHALFMGRTEQARKLFEQILSIRPSHSAAAYKLSNYYVQSDPVKALDYVKIAYSSDSTNIDIAKQYARILLINNKLDDVKTLLAQLRKSGRDKKLSYYFSIMLAGDMQDDDLVVNLAKEYSEIWGIDPQVVVPYSEALIRQKQYIAAEKLLEEAIQHNGTDQQLLISLAKLKAALRDDESALSLFHKAIEVDSLDYRPHLALSDYYRHKNDMPNFLRTLVPVFSSRYLEAEIKAEFFESTFFDTSILKENYQTIRQIAMAMYLSVGQNREVDRVMVRFLMYTGDLKMALSLLSQAIEDDRATADTYKNIIDIHLYNKEIDSVTYYSLKAEIAFPDNVDFPLSLAMALWQVEDGRGAIEYLKKAYRLSSNDSVKSVIHSFTGDILYKEGDKKGAFKSYDRALRLNPDNAILLNNYAYFLSLEKRRLNEALIMAIRANQLSENNATYLDTQAWILYELGRYDEAREVQRKAIGFNRDNSSELFLHYGDILFKLGENFLAETYWKRALAAGADTQLIAERLDQIK